MANNATGFVATGLPPTLLDRLPTELLDMAAGYIDKFDMLTHVNLCRVSQRVHALYEGRHDDEFWRVQCFMNGLGYVENHDTAPEYVLWKEIAFEVAEHADSCDGLCCGRIQLEKNRKSMETWLKTLPELSSEALPMDSYFTDDKDGIHVTMFEFITFRPSRIVDDYSTATRPILEWERDRPYLENFRPAKQGIKNKTEPLFEHIVASRSFAVCPPIKTLALVEFDLPDVQNECGVTIADLCETIMLKTNIGMDVSTITEMFPWDEDKTNYDLSVPGWSFRDHLRAFGTFGGWFRALKCKGFMLNFEIDAELFTFVFKPRDLPRKFSEFQDDVRSTSRCELESLSNRSS